MLRWWRPRRLSLLLAMVILVAVAGASPVGPATGAAAQSGDECHELRWVITGQDENGDPTYGWRYVNICQTGGGNQGGGVNTCRHSNPAIGTVDCTHPVYGWWSHSLGCYARLASPQPAAGDPDWEGNDPEDGAVYVLYCPEAIGGQVDWSLQTIFLTQSPGVPSVAQLAQQAMESLPLVGADIGIAPNPDGVGLVGVPVWLWTNNTSDTWGPVSRSIPGPGITVTARGEAEQISWDMGDGTTVVCDEPGIPYQAEFGSQKPECGHVYTYPSQSQPDGRYQITATTTWFVEWWVEPQGSGASGDQRFPRESSTSVQINELQVVTS